MALHFVRHASGPRLMHFEIIAEADDPDLGGFRPSEVGFDASADPPDGEITARMVHEVRLGDIQRQAINKMTLLVPVHARAILGDRKRPGRRGRPDLYYAEFAAAYVNALSSPAPIVTLAKQQNLSVSTVRNTIHEARRRGLLTRPPPGRPGGELTEKAQNLIKSSGR